MGQIVAEDLVGLRRRGDFRHASEVGGDDAVQEPFMMQAAGAKTFAVAGAGAHDERQVARRACFDVALLQRGVQSFRNTTLDKPGRRDDITFTDERDRFVG